MLRTLLKRLIGRTPTTPVETGLLAVPTNIPVPPQPANDGPPYHVPLMTLRDVLRHRRNDTLVQAGSTVVTKNGAEMKVARLTQKPPYVLCLYRGRRLAVRPDSIDCYWDQVSELIQ
jgi:hypothetical protein